MSENIAVPTQICIVLEFTAYDFCIRNILVCIYKIQHKCLFIIWSTNTIQSRKCLDSINTSCSEMLNNYFYTLCNIIYKEKTCIPASLNTSTAFIFFIAQCIRFNSFVPLQPSIPSSNRSSFIFCCGIQLSI